MTDSGYITRNISHSLACEECKMWMAVSEGRLRPETVDLFNAAHEGHTIVEKVTDAG